jgi:hypothetical protein
MVLSRLPFWYFGCALSRTTDDDAINRGASLRFLFYATTAIFLAASLLLAFYWRTPAALILYLGMFLAGVFGVLAFLTLVMNWRRIGSRWAGVIVGQGILLLGALFGLHLAAKVTFVNSGTKAVGPFLLCSGVTCESVSQVSPSACYRHTCESIDSIRSGEMMTVRFRPYDEGVIYLEPRETLGSQIVLDEYASSSLWFGAIVLFNEAGTPKVFSR